MCISYGPKTNLVWFVWKSFFSNEGKSLFNTYIGGIQPLFSSIWGLIKNYTCTTYAIVIWNKSLNQYWPYFLWILFRSNHVVKSCFHNSFTMPQFIWFIWQLWYKYNIPIYPPLNWFRKYMYNNIPTFIISDYFDCLVYLGWQLKCANCMIYFGLRLINEKLKPMWMPVTCSGWYWDRRWCSIYFCCRGCWCWLVFFLIWFNKWIICFLGGYISKCTPLTWYHLFWMLV